MTVDQCLVKMILVDTRSSVNVLFLNTFVQMDIPWSRILSYEAPIVGFTGKTIKSGEKITLPVSIGDTAHMVEFLIVSSPSLYNCIF